MRKFIGLTKTMESWQAIVFHNNFEIVSLKNGKKTKRETYDGNNNFENCCRVERNVLYWWRGNSKLFEFCKKFIMKTNNVWSVFLQNFVFIERKIQHKVWEIIKNEHYFAHLVNSSKSIVKIANVL